MEVTSAIFCMADGGLENLAADKRIAKPNVFKGLLAPQGKYPYDTGASKTQQTASQSRRTSRKRPLDTPPASALPGPIPATKKRATRATQPTVSAPPNPAARAQTTRGDGATGLKPARKTHGWDWVVASSSPRAGSPEAVELSRTLERVRETRSIKRKRVAEDA